MTYHLPRTATRRFQAQVALDARRPKPTWSRRNGAMNVPTIEVNQHVGLRTCLG